MINVIKINLNHAMSRASRREMIRERLRWSYFWGISVLLVVALVFLYLENGKVNDIITQKEDQIWDIKEQIKKLQQKGKNLSKADIMSLAELESGRIFWAEKFMELSKVLPEDMAITRIIFKNDILTIQGVSRIFLGEREFDVINRFIEALRKDAIFSEDFEDVKFSKFSRITVLKQDIVEFEILARAKSRSERSTGGGRS
ncbi:MAG: PilN domain-containing protein [Lentisphaeria bacterium]|nr:PilN domain-containing protein [Candidatus Neomarinimicrobiota bacterium]MCF7842550.1 PilN domain-containing protein [Lentisphaeria bacterium]